MNDNAEVGKYGTYTVAAYREQVKRAYGVSALGTGAENAATMEVLLDEVVAGIQHHFAAHTADTAFDGLPPAPTVTVGDPA